MLIQRKTVDVPQNVKAALSVIDAEIKQPITAARLLKFLNSMTMTRDGLSDLADPQYNSAIKSAEEKIAAARTAFNWYNDQEIREHRKKTTVVFTSTRIGLAIDSYMSYIDDPDAFPGTFGTRTNGFYEQDFQLVLSEYQLGQLEGMLSARETGFVAFLRLDEKDSRISNLYITPSRDTARREFQNLFGSNWYQLVVLDKQQCMYLMQTYRQNRALLQG
jgi:hypothetical protein